MTVEFGTDDLPLEDIASAIERLANLDPLAYEQTRKHESEKLGFRSAILDRLVAQKRRDLGLGSPSGEPKNLLPDVDPWPYEVDGAAVLDEVVALVQKYAVVPPHAAESMALWAAHTHALDAAYFTPRLAFLSAEKGSGKSTCLDIIGLLCSRSLAVANITSPALFRIIEAAHPVLLLDEADSFLRDSEDLRGTLNAGHKRGTPVARVEGEEREVRLFDTFGPVALAGIGNCLPETIYDRSIIINMKRALANERRAELRMDRGHDLKDAAAKLARFALDSIAVLKAADPKMPAGLFNRARDNWRSLLAIADVVGGHWPDTARKAAVMFSAVQDDQSIGVMLLEDMKEIFIANQAAWISSESFRNALCELEDRPWPEFSAGKQLSVRQIARTLAPFDIAPRQKWVPPRNIRGYEKTDFEDAWRRYLPGVREIIRSSARSGGNAGVSSNSATLEAVSPLADATGEKPNDFNDPSVLAGEMSVKDIPGDFDPFDLNSLETGTYGAPR